MHGPAPKYVWLDGKYVPASKASVPITTHALHYGTAAFEGIRAYWNGSQLNIFRLKEHAARLRRSARYYEMNLEYTEEQIAEAVVGMYRKNRIRESCYIRPFCFVGEYGINMHITKEAPVRLAIMLIPASHIFDAKGISVAVSTWRKFSHMATPSQAKMSGNYLNSIVATIEARRHGADEAIMLDHAGNVCEASGENIFVVKDREVFTPPASSGALDGITADSVRSISGDLGIGVTARNVARDDLYGADEIFLTGTAAGIIPVRSVDGTKIGDGSGCVTDSIIRGYEEITMGLNDSYAHWLTAVY